MPTIFQNKISYIYIFFGMIINQVLSIKIDLAQNKNDSNTSSNQIKKNGYHT